MGNFYHKICIRLDRVVNRIVPSGRINAAWHSPAGPKVKLSKS